MKLKTRFLLIGAAIPLPLGLGLWARSAASWRPQKIGTFPASLHHGFIEDAAHGPWVYQTDNLALNLENGSRAVIPKAAEIFPPCQHRFSPDGRSFVRLFQVNDKRLDYQLRIEWRECASGRLLRRFDKFLGEGGPHDVQFSPDGTNLLIPLDDGVETRPLGASKVTFHSLPVSKGERIFCLSPNGELVCAESTTIKPPSSSVKIYDVKTGTLIQTMTPRSTQTYMARFCPDSSLLVVTDVDPSRTGTWIGDTKSGARLWQVSAGGTDNNIRFRFAPDNQTVLVFDEPPAESDSIASWRGVELRDAHTGKQLRTFQVVRPLAKAAFSFDGASIYALDVDGALWKIRSTLR